MEHSNNRSKPAFKKDRRPNVSEIDVEHVIRYLTRQFRQKTEDMGRDAPRGSELYKLQCDFTYMLDEIKRGPTYQVSKIIAKANEMLDAIPTKA
jgi:hypothetical protein